MTARSVGRKEILTKEMADDICRMIGRMPDLGMMVSWENIMANCKRQFGHSFNRQALSQKQWGGRKLIAEAYSDAQNIQRRLKKNVVPKYSTASRVTLQKRLSDQDANALSYKNQLESVRSQQLRMLDAFLNTKLDLRELIKEQVGDL